MHKALERFMHATCGFTAAVAEYRYGGYVAILFKEDSIGDVISSMDDFNADGEWEVWGLGQSAWFPIGFGGSISQALLELNAKVANTEDHWDAMIPIMEHLSSGQKPGYHVSCPVLTIEDLRKYDEGWNRGNEDLEILVGSGLKVKEEASAAT